jgi:UDP-glucose 4-epimerase
VRILMTGSSGFLGQALVKAAPRDTAIFALSRNPFPASGENLRHVQVDLGSCDSLQKLVDDGALPDAVDVVLHLGVSRRHREFPASAVDMFNVNVATVALLLDFARQANVSKFVVGSTGTVYRPSKDRPHREDDGAVPGGYFALSKWIAERLALTYHPQYFDVFIPRYFSPYGPGQADRVISSVSERVRSGQPIRLPPTGDGFSTTPLYVDDAVRVLLAAIREGWTGTMNVGGPEVLTLVEMATVIGKAVGREPKFERSPDALDTYLVPDLGRLSAKMSISSFVPFSDGIARTLAGDA